MFRINLTSVLVDDQAKALAFYIPEIGEGRCYLVDDLGSPFWPRYSKPRARVLRESRGTAVGFRCCPVVCAPLPRIRVLFEPFRARHRAERRGT